jgi:peroxiredoxin (alkyl hydroperoxide reductase subunit C)
MDPLQATDEHQIATPANWQPGDKVIVPPPKTTELAEERVKGDYECVDWYLCKRDL